MGLGIILTANLLSEIAKDLCGGQKHWKRAIARLLGRDERMITYYATGDYNVPPEVRLRLANVCRERGERLIQHAENLTAK